MPKNKQQGDTPSDMVLDCMKCGSTNIETQEREDTFEYGGREKPFIVTARFPVHTCRECGFSFTDGHAEKLRHDAACRQLGVMTPDEVRAVREKYGMNQAKFAELTKLGEASLSRWERGVLIQNEANDQLLYLLRFPENVERLRQRNTADFPSPASSIDKVGTPAGIPITKEDSLSETKRLQQQFWEEFLNVPRLPGRPSKEKCYGHRVKFRFGRHDRWLEAQINTGGRSIAVELVLDGSLLLETYDALRKDDEAIKRHMSVKRDAGEVLEWIPKEKAEKDAKRRWIKLRRDDMGLNLHDPASWTEPHKWLQKRLETFAAVFASELKGA
jgi:putative zinc finger/helix-turn-helix YgiT family protein